jgi:formyltetrahydrofolate synthetase
MHGSSYKVVAGKPLPPELLEEDLELLRKGSRNLQKHIEIVKTFGVPCVVAVNRFATDSENELKLAQELALQYGAEAAAISDVHARGGEGGIELAEAVEAACREGSNFQLLYPDTASFKEKIEAICTRIYGARGVEYLGPAQKKLTLYEEWGYGSLPVCMAKTHLSLSHDAKLRNRPEGFTVTVRDVRLSAGAGFVYALLGEISTMPGLPAAPAFERIDIDAEGNIVGLS